MVKYVLSAVFLLLASTTVFADDYVVDTRIDQGGELALAPLYLAANDEARPVGKERKSRAEEEKVEFHTRWFTANKAHQYLGLASLALATAAILAPKDENDLNGPHHELAIAATNMGAAAIATGLVFHWEDLHFGRGFFSQPDNMHFLLGSLATLGYALAVNDAPESAHAALGAGGFVLMATAIKMTW